MKEDILSDGQTLAAATRSSTNLRTWATSSPAINSKMPFARFKALADRKKHVYDEDIEALVDEEIATAQDRIKLVSLTVLAGTRGPQRATMRLDIDGRFATEEAEGNGPVDATFNAIKAMVPHDARLELYQVHAVTEGTDAQAVVSVRLGETAKASPQNARIPIRWWLRPKPILVR